MTGKPVMVRDLMTVSVVTVGLQTPVKEIAALLLDRRISGVPVLEDGLVVGIVTESDLQPLHEGVPGRAVRTAADVMTRGVVSVGEDMTVTEAARVLQRHGIKRAPVLRGERLVGIVSRADLLRPYSRTDREIQAEIEEAVLAQALGVSPRQVRVEVASGVVRLEGTVGSARERALLARLVRSVDGVVDIEDDVAVVEDQQART